MDAGKDLTDLLMMDKQYLLTAKEKNIIAVETVVAVVPASDNNALLDVNGD